MANVLQKAKKDKEIEEWRKAYSIQKEDDNMKTYRSKSGKTYTKKQITEAISYWKKMLNEDVEYYLADEDGKKTGNAKYIDVDPEDVSKMANRGKIGEISGDDIVGWIEKKVGHSIALGDDAYEEIEAIEYDWNAGLEDDDKELHEARHDGKWLPSHPARRNPSEKKTVYFLAVDYSDNLSNYGQYIQPDGSLTDDASNDSFKQCAVTIVPQKALEMAKKAIQDYGDDMYIFLYHQPYTYGAWTHKNHARPAVIDIWYPNGKYWRYGLRELNTAIENAEKKI